jgi:hypothetical protein
MGEMFNGTETMMMIAVMVDLAVFISMMIDLASGMYKAWYRKEKWKSDYLKRTGFKFVLYEGALLIATCVDVLVHFSKLYQWWGWDMVYGLPLVTIGVGIFWCVVEFLSVREKADDKIHSEIARAERLAKQVLSREELVEILAEAMHKGTVGNTKTIEDGEG